MQMAKQLQFVLGASMTIKPLAHQEKLPEFWRGVSISCGPQGGVTTLADPNTVDFAWVCNVGVPSP